MKKITRENLMRKHGRHFNLFLREYELKFDIGSKGKLLVDPRSLLKESFLSARP
jgi:hypothetical protein